MSRIRIHKGHNIRIDGEPIKEVTPCLPPAKIAVHPYEFRSVKPKLLVKEGDSVKIGSHLFFDKVNPNVKWASPGAGKILSIQYGHRRVIEKIVIELNKNEQAIEHKIFDTNTLSSLTKEDVINHILEGGLWPMIRQRPFNKIANPNDVPSAIFVSGLNTAPLAVDLDIALRNKKPIFQAGINILSRLTKGNVHLTINENCISDTFQDVQNAKTHLINALHPAGNVGIQMHHIEPLTPGKTVWSVNAQHVITLGILFLKGVFDPTLFITAGGPGVESPAHYKTRMGVSAKSILQDNIKGGPVRVVSGDVLTGQQINLEGFLGFYETIFSVIPDSTEREFMSFVKPGSGKTTYSLLNVFWNLSANRFSFTTSNNGGQRAMIPVNAWEDVLPMDIMPNALYRAILAEDIEEMEQLGLIECDDEDFSLCSFACPSKIDVGSVIRKGLVLLEAEG